MMASLPCSGDLSEIRPAVVFPEFPQVSLSVPAMAVKERSPQDFSQYNLEFQLSLICMVTCL